MYCDYRDQKLQTAENVLGAILRQFMRSLISLPPKVWDLCERNFQEGLALSSKDLHHLLQIISTEFDQLYVCLDALDEIGELPSITKLLRDRPSNVRLFLTGRSHVLNAIQRYLPEMQTLSIEARKSDIKRFIMHEIGGSSDAEPDAMNDELRMNILQQICDSAKGM